MKLIVLGGGALQVKRIKLSKGITSTDFVNTVENGAAILEKLKERSNKIVWANRDNLSQVDLWEPLWPDMVE